MPCHRRHRPPGIRAISDASTGCRREGGPDDGTRGPSLNAWLSRPKGGTDRRGGRRRPGMVRLVRNARVRYLRARVSASSSHWRGVGCRNRRANRNGDRTGPRAGNPARSARGSPAGACERTRVRTNASDVLGRIAFQLGLSVKPARAVESIAGVPPGFAHTGWSVVRRPLFVMSRPAMKDPRFITLALPLVA